MTRTMRELLARREEVVNKAREAIENGTAAEVKAAREELEDINTRIESLRALETEEEREFENSRPKGERKDREELKAEYERVFLKAVRNRGLTREERDTVRSYRREIVGLMHEGGATTGAGQPDNDTSIVVPVDVETRINELIKQETNLAAYVRNEQVTTLSGSRVLEKRARHTPFQVIAEYGEVPELAGPEFEEITYKVKKRGGFLPLTSELLDDNDANLLDYIVRWLGQKVPATYNSLILPILNGITAGDVADADDIKKLKNVEIIPAFANRATWFTNQDGFNWLDTIKDSNGRYLLQDDIAAGTGKMLLGRPVVVVENELWPSEVEDTDTKAPLVFGDLTEYIVHFQRKGYELASTREGGDAWRRDTLEMRALMRDDFVTWDDAAVVAGRIVLP